MQSEKRPEPVHCHHECISQLQHTPSSNDDDLLWLPGLEDYEAAGSPLLEHLPELANELQLVPAWPISSSCGAPMLPNPCAVAHPHAATWAAVQPHTPLAPGVPLTHQQHQQHASWAELWPMGSLNSCSTQLLQAGSPPGAGASTAACEWQVLPSQEPGPGPASFPAAGAAGCTGQHMQASVAQAMAWCDVVPSASAGHISCPASAFAGVYSQQAAGAPALTLAQPVEAGWVAGCSSSSSGRLPHGHSATRLAAPLDSPPAVLLEPAAVVVAGSTAVPVQRISSASSGSNRRPRSPASSGGGPTAGGTDATAATAATADQTMGTAPGATGATAAAADASGSARISTAGGHVQKRQAAPAAAAKPAGGRAAARHLLHAQKVHDTDAMRAKIEALISRRTLLQTTVTSLQQSTTQVAAALERLRANHQEMAARNLAMAAANNELRALIQQQQQRQAAATGL